ncbi:hypothetical protein A2U01_0093936, partial [Trifolium medium]|nr:hypothetical protein [Trifolium medium]
MRAAQEPENQPAQNHSSARGAATPAHDATQAARGADARTCRKMQFLC